MAIITEGQEHTVRVLTDKILLLETVSTVLTDGVVTSRSEPHYCSIPPGSDVSAYPQVVIDIAGAVWTQAVIDAYQAAQPV